MIEPIPLSYKWPTVLKIMAIPVVLTLNFATLSKLLMDSAMYTRALAAADGLLAGLLYLRETSPILPISRGLNLWIRLNDIRVNLEHCRHRLIRSIRVLGLTSYDPVLDSLLSPTSFFEAAIFSFRYTLTGPAPDSLGNILALYALSHIASCDLSREGFPVIPLEDGIWRNAIRNPEHRQAFSSLVQTLWPDRITPPYLSLDLYPFQTALPGIFSTLYGAHQNMLGAPVTVTHNEHVLYPPEILLPGFFDGHLNLNTPQLPRQIVQSGYFNSTPDAGTPLVGPHTSHLLELQQSAVITNLIHFLESCGETLQILSGRNMATKDLNSRITLNQDVKQLIRTSYIQPLRGDEAFRGASALATLSVVERFVDLEYLQSIDEVREYMVFIGIETLPHDKTIVQYLQLVYAFADMAENELRKVKCAKCQKTYSTTSNLKRHKCCGVAQPNLVAV